MCKGAVTKDDMDHYAAITYHIAIAVLWRERREKNQNCLFFQVISMIVIKKGQGACCKNTQVPKYAQ